MQIELIAYQITKLCSAIEHIKRGRPERAVELLERGLDACVIDLGRIRKNADIPDQTSRDILIIALKAVCDHRRRNPRDTKPENSGDPQDDLQKAVDKILEEIGD